MGHHATTTTRTGNWQWRKSMAQFILILLVQNVRCSFLSFPVKRQSNLDRVGYFGSSILRVPVKSQYNLDLVNDILNNYDILGDDEPLWLVFHEMENNNQMDSPEALLLILISHYKGRVLNKKLERSKKNIINTWASHIRAGNRDAMSSYTSKAMKRVDSADIFTTVFLQELIQSAYSENLQNMVNILEFVNTRLPCLSQIGLSYRFLFDEMKRSNHLDSLQIIELAYYINIKMDRDQTNIYSAYKMLLDELPDGVRRLFWDPHVIILPRVGDHVSYTLPDDDEKWFVTLRDDHSFFPDDDGNWIGTLKDRDFPFKNKYFIISNNKSQVLLADDDGKVQVGDSTKNRKNYWQLTEVERRRIRYETSTYRKEFWQLTPVENGTYFYIKNLKNHRVLGWQDDTLPINFTTYPEYTGTHNQHWQIF